MESKVILFLDHLLEQHFEKAKKACSDAENEINDVERIHGENFTNSQKAAIEEVKKIISNLKRKQNVSARASALSTTSKYSQNVAPLLKKRQKEPTKDQRGSKSNPKPDPYVKDDFRSKTSDLSHKSSFNVPGEHAQYSNQMNSRSNNEDRNNANYSHTKQRNLNQYKETKGDSSQPNNSFQTSTKAQGETGSTIAEQLAEDHRQNEKSKRASQAMRLNNADIADLSDTNRPTKLAERFSELYDNEWTEAFESLSKQNLTEREIIKRLLEIVQKAYNFCEEEANEQLAKIQSAFVEILRGEQITGSKYRTEQNDKGKELLVQYRKGIAGEALQRLQGKFLTGSMLREDKIIKYATKAVEVAWWMAIQDPPVYMCPTTEFDPILYRAYTQSGKELDFFVWPALKLHRRGGVLMKGVVQYKNK